MLVVSFGQMPKLTLPAKYNAKAKSKTKKSYNFTKESVS